MSKSIISVDLIDSWHWAVWFLASISTSWSSPLTLIHFASDRVENSFKILLLGLILLSLRILVAAHPVFNVFDFVHNLVFLSGSKFSLKVAVFKCVLDVKAVSFQSVTSLNSFSNFLVLIFEFLGLFH